MNYEQPSTVEVRDHRCGIKCLSWTAVIAGAFVAIGLSFLLNLFGVAIGLSAYTTSAEGATVLAIGGFVGMAIAVMVAMFVAGLVSGYLGRAYCLDCNLGVLYGFVTWALALVLSILLASSVGQFVAMQYDALTNPNGIAVNISSSSSAPAMTTHNTAPTATASKQGTTKEVVVNDEKAAKALGKTLLLIFLLFFVGALTSCYGGYVGMMRCGRDKRNINNVRT